MMRRWKRLGAAVTVGALGIGLGVAPGSAAPVGWTQQFGTAAIDVVAGVGVAPNGEICATGYTNGTLPGQVANTAASDGFVTRFDKNGIALWTRQLGGAAMVVWNSVAVASNGDCFLVGYYDGTLSGVGASQADDVLLARYDRKGVLKSLKKLGSGADDQGYGIAISGSMVFVSGWTAGQIGATDPGSNDGFIARYDTNLNLKWVQQIGSDADEWGGIWTVSSNSTGDVFGVGTTTGAFTGKTNTAGDDGFVVKLDKNGKLKWLEQVAADSSNWAQAWGAVAVDNGGVVIAGPTTGALSGETNAGGEDLWIRRYDKNGIVQWSDQIGTASNDYGWNLAVSKRGFVYLTGYTDGGAFPGFTNLGGLDWVVAKFAVKTGAAGGVRQLGTTAQDGDAYTGTSIAVAPSGTLILASFTRGAIFGHANAGDADAVVFQLQP